MPLLGLIVPMALALCLLAGSGVAWAGAGCPKGESEFPEDDLFGLAVKDAEFEGTVAGEQVRLYLAFDYFTHTEHAIRGAIRRMERPAELPGRLTGVLGTDCLVTVTEDESAEPKARWTLRLEPPSRLVGHYQRGGEATAVRLQMVEPQSCDGHESWRTYHSPSWPITFDYPASWLVDIRDRPLSAGLACPNLRARAYYYSVDVIELTGGLGSGTMETKEGRLIRSIGNFFTEDGRVWFYGHCPEGGFRGTDDCPTRQSTINGVTVLQVHSDTARNGVDMHSFLFLAPTGWVTFDTLDLNASVEGQGELVFDGQGSVLERFVRSMKPTAPTP